MNGYLQTLSLEEQSKIADDIAYPDETKPEMQPGAKFFAQMRYLTLTGFYSSEAGMKDVGYMGNRANEWDGVPQEELDRVGLSYPQEWEGIYVDMKTRHVKAEWDEEGKLLT